MIGDKFAKIPMQVNETVRLVIDIIKPIRTSIQDWQEGRKRCNVHTTHHGCGIQSNRMMSASKYLTLPVVHSLGQ